MFNARKALVLAGLAFATWEAVDIFWISTPAAAAVMAVLFLSCTIWYWRRDSMRAAVALLLLFAFEAVVAPTLKAMPKLTVFGGFHAIARVSAIRTAAMPAAAG